MNWLVWRQHRKLLYVSLGLLCLYVIALLIDGANLAHAYRQTQLHQNLDYWAINYKNSLLADISVAIPALMGIFWGVPLIAQEYEKGTNAFVWTQSTSRKKWLTAQLGWMLVAALIVGTILALAVTWWSRTENSLLHDRFDTLQFSIQGLVPVTYAIFSVSLGAAIGAWLKRVLGALALTLVLIITLQAAVAFCLRPHYLTPVVYQQVILQHGMALNDGFLELSGGPGYSIPTGSWVLSSGVPTQPACKPPLHTVVKLTHITCISTSTYVYQPAYRYWDFQRIEAGLCLALSLLSLGVTYWLVLRRDA